MARMAPLDRIKGERWDCPAALPPWTKKQGKRGHWGRWEEVLFSLTLLLLARVSTGGLFSSFWESCMDKGALRRPLANQNRLNYRANHARSGVGRIG